MRPVASSIAIEKRACRLHDRELIKRSKETLTVDVGIWAVSQARDGWRSIDATACRSTWCARFLLAAAENRDSCSLLAACAASTSKLTSILFFLALQFVIALLKPGYPELLFPVLRMAVAVRGWHSRFVYKTCSAKNRTDCPPLKNSDVLAEAETFFLSLALNWFPNNAWCMEFWAQSDLW